MRSSRNQMSRRGFLRQGAASAGALGAGALGSAALLGLPTIVTAKKTASPVVVGDGDYRFEVQHQWLRLPERFTWQITQNIARDAAGCVYVIHRGDPALKDHPAIFVFDPEGTYIRSFGQQFQGGGHGIDVRREGNEEFLYVSAYHNLKNFAKLTLDGEQVWLKRAPMDSRRYAPGEDTNPTDKRGRDNFMPTNFAFLDDGGFLLADGYGAYCIHRYDKDANWLSCFGTPGQGDGEFDMPHGVAIDRRGGREPAIVVCDRANHRLQHFDLDGKYQRTVAGFSLPSNAATWNDLLVIPELNARITLLGKDDQVVARLGDDSARITGEGGMQIRNTPTAWIDGRFVHPHDACFTDDGDILVAEWVGTGRVSRLKRLS